MRYEIYEAARIADDFSFFEFVSIGRKGIFPKRISFIPTEYVDVYILAFGDIINDNDIDDLSISDNGDRNKILATVAVVVTFYTGQYPERMIYFKGSSKERTRLYRIAIGLNLDELAETFDIFVEVDQQDQFIPFQKNMEINAFLIKRKQP